MGHHPDTGILAGWEMCPCIQAGTEDLADLKVGVQLGPCTWMGRQGAHTHLGQPACPLLFLEKACFFLGSREKPVWEQVGLGCLTFNKESSS